LTRSRSYLLPLAIAIAIAAAALWSASDVAAQGVVTPPDPAAARLQDEQNTIDVVRAIGPSVVAINVEVRGEVINPFQDFPFLPEQFRQLLPRQTIPRVQQSSGSGFVIDEAGLIVTNYHVVEAALRTNSIEPRDGASITVEFPDGDEPLSARVRGANPDYDLALLELDDPSGMPSGVRAIELADSNQVEVGQKVIAIGNPFGLQSTVTTGIVSAIGREITSIGQVDVPMIQTDAAINPGNSGGPLLDSSGRLVGINTMIVPGMSASGRAGNIGIGFAVPSSLLAEALPDMREGGLAGFYAASQTIGDRARLGVQVIAVRDYPEEAREALRLPDHGVVVYMVEAGGPAEEAGIVGATFMAVIGQQQYPAGGDVILEVDGRRVETAQDLQAVVLERSEGDVLTLTVWRDGRERQVDVTLRVVPQSGQQR
jgi:serine protease Do